MALTKLPPYGDDTLIVILHHIDTLILLSIPFLSFERDANVRIEEKGEQNLFRINE